MSIFVDASALVAIITDEPEAEELVVRLSRETPRYYSVIAVWEAAIAIGRKQEISPEAAAGVIDSFVTSMNLELLDIGEAEALEAITAFRLYGKRSGTKARLNLGDCFAYACAKTSGARLLYKGDDFRHTDLA